MQERKLTVGGVIATIILGCLILALLIYTATRTIHFLQMTFPPSMSYVAYLALAAFDGGIIGWTIFATFGSEGPAQRAIAYLMIFICAIGVILTTVADTLIVSQDNHLTKAPPDIATVGLWGSIAIIVLNVLAGITVHLASPHHIRKWQMETMRDDVYRAAMKHTKTKVSEQIPALAQGMANFEIQRLAQELVGHLPPAAPPQTRQIESARIVDSPRLAPAKAAHVRQKIDPHKVKPQVDSEKKSIEEKKSIFGRFHDGVDKVFFKNGKDDSGVADGELEPPVDYEEEEEIETVDPMEEELEEDNPAKWNLVDWRQYRNEADAWTFDQTWKEYNGETPFPDDRPQPKKRTGGKKAKKQVDQAD